jgi:hypothetical protein
MTISINKKLNLVLPVETDKGKIWVHSVPLLRDVFESNYMLLTRTLSNLYGNGIGPAMAPRVARLVLRDTAKEMDDTTDISNNLMNEIYRMTNVLMPSSNGAGWEMHTYYEVKSKKLVDDETLSEVENAIIYFIVASAVHLRSELPMAYQGLKQIWKAETTLLDITEYGNSLKMSITEENIGEKSIITVPPKIVLPRASSIPS